MDLFLQFLLTMTVGFLAGVVFLKLKIPGGMLVGSIFGVAVLNVCIGVAFVPPQAKVLAQLTAGAFIGSTVNKDDLMRLRHIYKPAIILMCTYFTLNITLGFLIFALSPLDLPTSLFSAVPGGISDITLISTDLGADTPKVAVLQFMRLLLGIGFFPGMINLICKDEAQTEEIPPTAPTLSATKKNNSPVVFVVTMAAAVVFGVAGSVLKVPAGALLFSMVAIVVLKFVWTPTRFPMWLKRVAQLLSGAFIACSINADNFLEFRFLVVPTIILVVGYSLHCFFAGWLLNRFCGFGRKEGMLAATPAGASDMALISIDMGVQSGNLVALHVLRLVVVSSIFPQIIHLILIIFKA